MENLFLGHKHLVKVCIILWLISFLVLCFGLQDCRQACLQACVRPDVGKFSTSILKWWGNWRLLEEKRHDVLDAPYATYFEDWKHAWKEWSLLGWAPLCTWFGLFITKVACIYAWKIFGGGNFYSRKLFLLCTYYQDSAGLLNSWLTLLEEFQFELLISVSTQFQWQYPQGWSISDFIFHPFSCTDEHSLVTYKRCSPCW
jgi:hypothetical protein